MWDDLVDRLTYALLGLLSGILLAAAVYLVFEQGWRFAPSFPRAWMRHPRDFVLGLGFETWVAYLGGGFALTGFLFRFHVGTAVGWAFKLMFHWLYYRNENPRMSTMRGYLWLLAAMVALWFFW
jgi:hypothetical protein